MGEKIAVVIPTYNDRPLLARCLEALVQQTYKDFHVYVCVDGSTDGTQAYLREKAYPFVTVLEHEDGKNHGRNATRNLALKYLKQRKHTYVALLDADTIPMPDYLERLMAEAPSPDEVVMPCKLYFGENSDMLWAQYRMWRWKRLPSVLQRQVSFSYKYFCTDAIFFHVNWLEKAGLHDDKLSGYGLGDVEWGYRIAQKGARWKYVPSACVWIEASDSIEKVLRKHHQLGNVNLHRIYAKHPSLRKELYFGHWMQRGWRKLIWRLLMSRAMGKWAYRLTCRHDLLKLRLYALHYLLGFVISWGYWGKPLPTEWFHTSRKAFRAAS